MCLYINLCINLLLPIRVAEIAECVRKYVDSYLTKSANLEPLLIMSFHCAFVLAD